MADPQSTMVANEQRKLAATLFNNLATAMIITGVIAPTAAYIYQATSPHGPLWFGVAPIWLAAALVQHVIARNMLKGIKP